MIPRLRLAKHTLPRINPPSTDVNYSNISVLLLTLNPYPANVIYFNFQPLEVVNRGSETQPQVVENYSYLFHLRTNSDYSDLITK